MRAHQHAAGAKGGPQAEALGRGRGGITTKIHLRVERHGKPMVFVLSGESGTSGRCCLKGRRIGAVIPTHADEAPDPTFERSAYRERNVAERTINRPKRWRRIATRYEKRATIFRAMLTVAAIPLWL